MLTAVHNYKYVKIICLINKTWVKIIVKKNVNYGQNAITIFGYIAPLSFLCNNSKMANMLSISKNGRRAENIIHADNSHRIKQWMRNLTEKIM